MVPLPAITPYRNRNASAPDELNLFAFLVGKWKGTGKARLPEGGHASFELSRDEGRSWEPVSIEIDLDRVE